MILEFREVANERERQELNQVRIRSYRQSILAGLLEDEDKFCKHDRISHHYGLFDSETGRAVGGLRVTAFSETIQPSLPLLEYAKAPAIQNGIREIAFETPLVEATRLSILQGKRARGWAKHIVDSAIAIHRVGRDELSVLICHRGHVAFYRRMGYRTIFEDHPYEVPGGIGGVTLIGPYFDRAEARRRRLVEMADAFENEGCLRFDESGFVRPVRTRRSRAADQDRSTNWGESTGTWG